MVSALKQSNRVNSVLHRVVDVSWTMSHEGHHLRPNERGVSYSETLRCECASRYAKAQVCEADLILLLVWERGVGGQARDDLIQCSEQQILLLRVFSLHDTHC